MVRTRWDCPEVGAATSRPFPAVMIRRWRAADCRPYLLRSCNLPPRAALTLFPPGSHRTHASLVQREVASPQGEAGGIATVEMYSVSNVQMAPCRGGTSADGQ